MHLGRLASPRPESLSVIAERQKIPLPYLEQIFSKLKKAKIVHAVRGPEGGYQLNRQPAQISLADIITVLEGPLEPALCTFPENRTEDCHEVGGCVSRHVCKELDGQIMKTLSSNTLETFCGNA